MADADNRSTTEIEQDIEATRAELDRTISAIEEKLSPGQVVDEMFGYFRNRPGSGGDLVFWLRENPVPVILIGIGLAWLIFGSRNPQTAYLPAPGSRRSGESVPMGPHGERRSPDASVDVARAPASAALGEDLRRSNVPDTEIPNRFSGTAGTSTVYGGFSDRPGDDATLPGSGSR